MRVVQSEESRVQESVHRALGRGFYAVLVTLTTLLVVGILSYQTTHQVVLQEAPTTSSSFGGHALKPGQNLKEAFALLETDCSVQTKALCHERKKQPGARLEKAQIRADGDLSSRILIPTPRHRHSKRTS